MKNKKVVLSVLSTAVVASMATSAFAAPQTGVYLGGDVKKFYPMEALLHLTATGEAKFAQEYLQLDAANKLDEVVFVTEDGDAVVGASIEEILEEGYDQAIQEELQDSDFLDSYLTADTDGNAGAAYDPWPSTPAGELKVESVSAINLKQVKVEFNKAVDETEGSNIANYFVGLEGNTSTNVATQAGGGSVKLADDKKSAIITLNNGSALVNFSTANKVTVSKAVGLAEDYVKTDLAASDTAFPTLDSVTATGPRELTLVFSEPLDNSVSSANTISSLVLDNGAVALDPTSAVYTAADKKLVIKTYSDLTAGTHTLKIKSGSANLLKDFSGASVVPAEKTFTYTADTTAPTVSVKSHTENSVTIKFNKTVSGVRTNNVVFSHTYQGYNQVLGGSASVTGSGDEYTITFPAPFPPGTARVYIDYAAGTTDANKIKDNYGNIFQPTSFTVDTTADTTKPVVNSVDFVDANHVKVTFSEDVQAGSGTNGAENPANYTLRDSTGATVQVTGAAFQTSPASNKVVVLTTAQLNGGAYTLEIKNVKDRSIAGNTLDTVTKSFTATDLVPPNIADLLSGGGTSYDALLVGTKKVKIGFTEAMKKESIENKDNYLFQGSPLPAGTTITAAADLKSVIVDFTNTTTTPAASNTFTVGRVEDAAGNKIAAFQTTVTVQAATAPAPSKIEAIGKNQIQLSFDEIIINPVATDFAVDVDGTGSTGFKTPASISVTNNSGKTTITLITQDAMTTGFATTNDKPVVRTTANSSSSTSQAAAGSASNEFGAKVNINDVKADDKIAPELTSTNPVVTVDQDGDNKIDHIKVTFTETMSPAYVNASSFAVAGYDILGVTTDSNGAVTSDTDLGDAQPGTTVFITVKEKDSADLGATPSVTVGTIRDTAGNAFAGQTVTAVDGMAPTASVVAASTAGGDALVNIAEKAAGFNVVATSNKLGTLYVVPAGTTATKAAIQAAAIASAPVTVAGGNTTISVPAASTGVTDTTQYVVYAIDSADNVSAATSTAFTADLTAPTATAATSQVAANGGTITITFSEALSATAKTNVETAISAATTQGTLGYSWNAANTVLTVTNSHATDNTNFAADVTANITDVAGNPTNNAVVVDLP
ncbi:hypothetical protein G3578_10555 [Brevibacillus sp. SYP-B805]|uniref:beta strand repeat-containing protein n=1 Tax=Brevibacillus sp. SYP-B805 TaxID=1578199 RepID=UPI0013EC34FD|nr:hypothetical protein [Brevibacillus sp. SYP-B805]NGQ95595.1 hypothetical protein [Brevibacillus sp. SYP-B805]